MLAGAPVIPLCPPARADVSSWVLTDVALDIVLADLDGDGDLDVAAVGDGTLELAFNVGELVLIDIGSGALTVLHAAGDGLGRFTNPMALAGSMGQWTAVLVGPLDGDTLPDMVATRIEGSFGRVAVRLGVGPGAWSDAIELDGRHSAVGSALADFDGDGRLDLVSASHQNPLISVLLGDGRGGCSCEQTYPGVRPGGAEQIAVGDIDGDGGAELVAVERATTVVTVVRLP